MMHHACRMARALEVMFIHWDQNLKAINYSTPKQLVSIIVSAFIVEIQIVLNWWLKESLKRTCVSVSKPAPNFEAEAVVNGEFTQLSLKDFAGKYVVFFFYPLDL